MNVTTIDLSSSLSYMAAANDVFMSDEKRLVLNNAAQRLLELQDQLLPPCEKGWRVYRLQATIDPMNAEILSWNCEMRFGTASVCQSVTGIGVTQQEAIKSANAQAKRYDAFKKERENVSV